MGVMVIMWIYDLFLQLLLLYHMGCEVCFSRKFADRLSVSETWLVSLWFRTTVHFLPDWSSFVFMYWLCMYMILHDKGEFLRLNCLLNCLHYTPMCWHIIYLFADCVCVDFGRVGLGVWWLDEVRRWAVVLGPHHPGSSLCSRNLSLSLLRQWGEHVRLLHMVARVTCSLCLTLIFWPSEQRLSTLMTRVLLHLPPWLSGHQGVLVPPLILSTLSQIICVWHVCVLRAVTLTILLEVILTNDVLSESLVDRIPLFVCLLSVSPDKRLTGPPPSTLHPSTVLLPARQTWLSSLPPACIGLLSSHLCKYEREMERGRVEKGEMEKYPSLWLLGGAQKKRIPHSWANLHSHWTSPVHSRLFLLSVFSLNPFSFSVTSPIAIVG